MVQDCLRNCKQRTRRNSAYSSWETILFGIPQGLVLRPLLFKIFLCDLFFIIDDIDFASYADDNTPCTIGNDMANVISKLRNSLKLFFQWFMDNQMKANPQKCQFICSTNDTVNLVVENRILDNSKCEKLLGVKFDDKLTFITHIDDICRKAGLKLNALSRMASYMDFIKKRLLVNGFFMSQFDYCPLIWMCHKSTKNNKINRIHERCLR